MRRTTLSLLVAIVHTATGGAVRADVFEIFPGQSFRSAVMALEPGDTLIVHEGEYADEGTIRLSVRGTRGQPVVIRGAEGEALPHITRTPEAPEQNTINIEAASYVTIQNLEISGNGSDGVRLNHGPSSITLEGLHIHGVEKGIAVRSGAQRVLIRRSHIHATNGTAIVAGAVDSISELVIDGNWIHDIPSGGAGVELASIVHSSIVRNNVFHDIGGMGVVLFTAENRMANLVDSNVFWSCALGGVQVTADATVRNNVILAGGGVGFLSSPTREVVSSNLTVVHNSILGGDPGAQLSGWGEHRDLVFSNNVVVGGVVSVDVRDDDIGGVISGNVVSPSPSGLPAEGFVAGGAAEEEFASPAGRDLYPRESSTILGAADPAHATPADFNGVARDGQPEAGAYTWTGATNPGWIPSPGFKPADDEDCNGNGIVDREELLADPSSDCNANGIPDTCETVTFQDCNVNGTHDVCEIREGLSPDCNSNGVPDECDLEEDDCDENGIPDTCESDYVRFVHLRPGGSFKLAAESLEPGDVLVVHEGIYADAERISIQVRGTRQRPITIQGVSGENRPLITRLPGSSIQNTINLEGAAYLRVTGLEISSNGGDGVRLHQAPDGVKPSHVVLEDLEIHNVDVGINLRTDMQHITIRRNHIYRTGMPGVGEGIYVGCHTGECVVSHCLIERNWIHDTLSGEQGDGIEIKLGSHSNVIRDNVIYNTKYPGLILYGTLGMPANVVERNVLWNCADASLQVAGDAIIRNNLFLESVDNAFVSRNHAGATPQNLQFIHNTIVGGNPCVRTDDWSSKPGIVFANNAIYCADGYYRLSDWSGVEVGGNVLLPIPDGFPAGGAVDGRSVDLDFVAAAVRDVYPTASSPLLGAGVLAYTTDVDFNGTPRGGRIDAGAYTWTEEANPGWAVQSGFKDVPFQDDCNQNGRSDNCDVRLGPSRDCNFNGIPDGCDISSGAAVDDDGDGIPDDCHLSPEPFFVRGDSDSNGSIELTDGLVILVALFQSGDAPQCDDAADVDDNGILELTDAVRIFQWLFVGPELIPLPPSPSVAENYPPTDCGVDPDPDPDPPDGLDCAVPAAACAP